MEQGVVFIKGLYHRAIYDIMDEHEISGLTNSPSHVVPEDAEFKDVLQYTEWHIGYKSRTASNLYRVVNEHYRYDRYRSVLNHRRASERRQAHVDIGCGAGVFSWAFLDWATTNGVGYDRVRLYGQDRCEAMVELAQEIRDRLAQNINDYPDLYYSSDVEVLLRQLTEHHREGTDYTITFGHVLVQSHTSEDIQTFTRVISYIIELMDQQSNCVLIAVDANGQSGIFTVALDLLRADVRQAGIQLGRTINPGASVNLTKLVPPQR